MANNAENVSIWWRHHVRLDQAHVGLLIFYVDRNLWCHVAYGSAGDRELPVTFDLRIQFQWLLPSKHITRLWRRYYVKTTSFWRNYVKMTSFWRNNDVIITSCVQGVSSIIPCLCNWISVKIFGFKPNYNELIATEFCTCPDNSELVRWLGYEE